jgi:hypothetical protein
MLSPISSHNGSFAQHRQRRADGADVPHVRGASTPLRERQRPQPEARELDGQEYPIIGSQPMSAFLLSPQSGYIAGQTIDENGGYRRNG